MKNKTKFYKQSLNWIKEAEAGVVEQEQPTSPSKPFTFPGLTNIQFQNDRDRAKILGYEQENTLPGTIMEYGIPAAVGVDAANTMFKPNRFDWNTIAAQAKAQAKLAREAPGTSVVMNGVNRGMNGFFAPVSQWEAIRHGWNAATSEEPVEKRIAEGGLALADEGIALSSMGQLLASNPALAIRAANGARGAGFLRPFMRLAPKMGPFMAAELALELGLKERETLDRGLKVYNSDQLGTTLNGILRVINGNLDQYGDVRETPLSEIAPATVRYTNQVIQNANNFKPPYKPNTPGILYHDPIAMVPHGLRPTDIILEAAKSRNDGILWPIETAKRSLGTAARFYGNMLQREGHEWFPRLFTSPGAPELDSYAAGKVDRQRNAVSEGFQSLAAMQNNQKLQNELPDRVKYRTTPDGIEPRTLRSENFPVDDLHTVPGDQVVNAAVSQAYHNAPRLAGSSGGLMGDIHKMGKKPKVETESWFDWFGRMMAPSAAAQSTMPYAHP